jgi:dephospho-CoA kinase
MLIIGLTGGIGTGKSTVAKRFSELGVPVIDADQLARDLVQPGEPALQDIVNRFGPEALRTDGTLDRAHLRGIVFSHPDQRKALEAILHPRIRAEMQRRVLMLDAPYCILSIPLLVEAGQGDTVDRVLVVDASESIQRMRVAERDGLSGVDADAVFKAQASRAERLSAADDVIVNDGDFDGLIRQVDALHDRYIEMVRRQSDKAK